mmetsp:Transcript_12261/g.21875  ORF Transcript_12261/g.21875 Transcript_12261/m.21875 type:complete len:1112 (-) Transcript_12261:37-3372(-)
MMEQEKSLGTERKLSFDWDEDRPSAREDYGRTPINATGKTIARLRRGIKATSRAGESARMTAESSSRGKLGMIEGVFFRVLTNILGVILFLRLGWMVGYAGIYASVTIVVLCSSLTLITTMSLSAICTNGKVAGGGAYYLISRALGPEFGASIGVLFYVATSVSVSLYLLGFGETVVGQLDEPMINESWDLRIIAFLGLVVCQCVCLVGVSIVVKVEKYMLYVVLTALVLFVAGCISGPNEDVWIGQVDIESRNTGADFAGSSIPMPLDLFSQLYNRDLVEGGPDRGLTSPTQCIKQSADILREDNGNINLGITLAVFFPAVTGIMAGANVSGDLKDPSYAIPHGTTAAIVLGAFLYIVLVVLFGTSFHRTTIVWASFAQNDTALGLRYECEYGGLFHDSLLVAEASLYPGVVYFGIYAASLSSGLAALLGAPRILQALARDRLFSMFDPLAVGYGESDEPLRAYGVTFCIAALCILAGDINTVAPLITTFFLSSYAMVNYACFSAEESASPGWRPTFRFFNKWLAFAGALGCVSVMLFLSAITGFITFVIGLALYKFVEVSTREGLGSASNWGPHKEAQEYITALRSALLLEEQSAECGLRLPNPVSIQTGQGKYSIGQTSPSKSRDNSAAQVEIELGEHSLEDYEAAMQQTQAVASASYSQSSVLDSTHVKNYRPQCLVLAGKPSERPALAVLVAGLRKSNGLTVFGDVLVGELSDPKIMKTRNARASVSYLSKYGIKAFNDVIIAPALRTGFRSLMQVSGIGRKMRVNTVVLGFLDEWRTPLALREQRRVQEQAGNQGQTYEYSPPVSVADYVGTIGDAFDLGLGVILLRGELDLLRSEYLMQTIRTEMDNLLSLGMTTGPVLSTGPGAYHDANFSSDARLEINAEEEKKVEHGSLPAPSRDRNRVSEKRIDVWWLVDDGGLTIMLPHILRQARTPPWVGCSLRVMAVGGTAEQAAEEEEKMRSLLSKLRISADVQAVSLEQFASQNEHNSQTKPSSVPKDEELDTVALDDGNRKTSLEKDDFENDNDLGLQDNMSQNQSRRKTYEQVGDLIVQFSSDALMVVASLPVPPMSLAPEEYMQWIDLISAKSEPPVLLVRGSQRDVVTVFS